MYTGGALQDSIAQIEGLQKRVQALELENAKLLKNRNFIQSQQTKLNETQQAKETFAPVLIKQDNKTLDTLKQQMLEMNHTMMRLHDEVKFWRKKCDTLEMEQQNSQGIDLEATLDSQHVMDLLKQLKQKESEILELRKSKQLSPQAS